jgi:hypothetical protein
MKSKYASIIIRDATQEQEQEHEQERNNNDRLKSRKSFFKKTKNYTLSGHHHTHIVHIVHHAIAIYLQLPYEILGLFLA